MILNFILLLVKNQTLIESESLGAKRETRERGIKREAVEIWEPKSYVFFFFFGKKDSNELIVVVFKWIYTCIKIHRPILQKKKVNFTVL